MNFALSYRTQNNKDYVIFDDKTMITIIDMVLKNRITKNGNLSVTYWKGKKYSGPHMLDYRNFMGYMFTKNHEGTKEMTIYPTLKDVLNLFNNDVFESEWDEVRFEIFPNSDEETTIKLMLLELSGVLNGTIN